MTERKSKNRLPLVDFDFIFLIEDFSPFRNRLEAKCTHESKTCNFNANNKLNSANKPIEISDYYVFVQTVT